MAEIIRRHDWAASPLGPIEAWPDRLRFALEICLRTSSPSAVYWGPDFILLHNDAFGAWLGLPEPRLLGQPAQQAYGELWDWLSPQFQAVMESGQGLSVAEQIIPVARDGVIEERYWTYTLSPLTDETGAVAGILSQREEVTRAVLAERRLSFQIRLADALRGETDPQRVKQVATALLGEHLGASRVGYAEVDEARQVASVRSDWTRDGSTSLAGQHAPLSSFGSEALGALRSGEVLVLPDLGSLPAASPELVAAWNAMGVRALITVPLVRDGALRALLYVHEPEPRAWRRSDAAIARDVAERTWAAVERAQAERSLRESEDHYRHTVELNPQVTWTATPDGALNRVARRWEEWTGTTGLGDSWAEGIHPEDVPASFAAWRHSLETGDVYDIEHRLKLRDGSFRWARSRAFPRHGKDGAILLWYGSTEDIHERKVAEEHQRLLINELNHRVKNTLASVQAIAFQTLKGDVSLAEARARFEARLLALSRAHNLLTERNWEGAGLERIVRDATEHLAGDTSRFELRGEGELSLRPRAALALALALHELVTNAAKYGARSSERGRVSIAWREEQGTLLLEWKETGGPEVNAPERRGFGSRLIERGLAPDLAGRADLDFEPDGLRCTIRASVEAVRAADLA
ncbi:sensor histidine kinase [Sphingomonas parva]|nr:HWE histidine kinase domain-containing protein [Sphingomonas parva]